MERRVSKAQQAVLFGEDPPRAPVQRRMLRKQTSQLPLNPTTSLGQSPAKFADTLDHFAKLHPGWMFARYMQDAAATIRILLDNSYKPDAPQWVEWYSKLPGNIKDKMSLNDYKDICTTFMSHLGLRPTSERR